LFHYKHGMILSNFLVVYLPNSKDKSCLV